MLEKLDRHTGYIDPETARKFNDDTRGEFSGIGVQIRKNNIKDQLQVVTPILGSNDEVTLKIGDANATEANKKERQYKYKILKDDSFENIVNALVTQINASNSGAGDPQVGAQRQFTPAAERRANDLC